MSVTRSVYVLTYDITDDARRTHMADLLVSQGTRVQRSVFEFVGDDAWLRTLVARATTPRCFSPESDSLRSYALCANCRPRASQWGVSPALVDPQRPLVL